MVPTEPNQPAFLQQPLNACAQTPAQAQGMCGLGLSLLLKRTTGPHWEKASQQDLAELVWEEEQI